MTMLASHYHYTLTWLFFLMRCTTMLDFAYCESTEATSTAASIEFANSSTTTTTTTATSLVSISPPNATAMSALSPPKNDTLVTGVIVGMLFGLSFFALIIVYFFKKRSQRRQLYANVS